MTDIKTDVTPFRKIVTANRREVVINRLRAGCCLTIHKYLMEGPDAPPVCVASATMLYG